ncbi:MAG: hydrogenase small subunit [Spirochaetota bacterium]|nr:hydrogenase small subunit [Spirochaetota bacterium]
MKSDNNSFNLNRRDFLKLFGGTVAALSIPSAVLEGCKKEIQKAIEATPVIWLQGQSCSGCSVSLLNTTKPDAATLITKYISLNFHQTISAGTGHVLIDVIEDALKKKRKDFILVVEGSIPTKGNEYCTLGIVKDDHVDIEKWVSELGNNAKAVIAVGTCAAFGGIPAARGNVTGAKSVIDILPKRSIINVPGCPPHPDWITGTIVHYLLYGKPELDEFNRPKYFFAKTVHDMCEHLPKYKKGEFAQFWGDEGCLYLLGCLGIDSNCDIPKRKWMDGVSSCTDCGSGCIGCTEKVFPDTGNRGLYMHRMAECKEGEVIDSEEAGNPFEYSTHRIERGINNV